MTALKTVQALGWRIERTQLEGELSIVPPLTRNADGHLIQPRGICVAEWSTTHDSRVLYSLALALIAQMQREAVQPAATDSRPEFSPYNQGWKDGYKHGAWAAQPAESSKALSDDEIDAIGIRYYGKGGWGGNTDRGFARAILARAGIGEKNHG